MQEAHEILINVMSIALPYFVHLNYQISKVLIPERWHVTVPIAMGIRSMTAGTLFVENPPTQPQIHAIARLNILQRRRLVQISRDIYPGLWLAQALP
jgi:hypothetical protein